MIFFFFCLREYLKRRLCRLEFLRTCLSCRKLSSNECQKIFKSVAENTRIKDIQGAKWLSKLFYKKSTIFMMVSKHLFVLALLIDSVRFCWLGVFDRHDFRHATLITLGKHLATRVVLLCLLEFCIFSS